MRIVRAALIATILSLPLIGTQLLAISAQDLPSAAAASSKQVVDMAGRKVSLPKQINRIVTVGAVPVLNSFIFAMGEGDKIANGLPTSFSSSRYKYQARFAPALAAKPKLQAGNSAPDLEELLKLNPDVIFTMDLVTADSLSRRGMPTVFLSWRQPKDVMELMRLVGEVLNKPAMADKYVKYFEATLQSVSSIVARIPREQRPRVLYCSLRRLTQDHLIAEWWIEAAGGISVTNAGHRQMEAFSFSPEHMLLWNPDVLIVASPDDLEQLKQDERFSRLKAVQTHRVYVAPIGAHLWANRTSELPLMLLWSAQKFYPIQCKNLDMVREMLIFYKRFFGYTMAEAEAKEILSGTF